ncbi:uncharacterized protein A1O5_12298 [Cladophialophora psammophila CBS 110553]|uniref:Cupin type-2 domain-containing protein n=1 Tax=Cladophialophora psammophila CBS 110553 TaxID=1182543 RepID=W9VUM4_9EURO|nr:uncharacterized protein A1O5_12298 [Cladophialophora psammophila CBS 110553]EXJ59417.1 hypothetical protein A1O5_12298 [Cladophialophora psammophila CBS 110553]
MSSSLPRPRRFVTGNDSTGLSRFTMTTPETPPQTDLRGMQVSFCFATTQFPVSFDRDWDLREYQRLVDDPPGIVVPNGTVFRMVDFPPGYTSPMHQTISINYNVVVEGQLEVVLDSGESRILNRGDSIVQRAINHAWRNTSDTAWARLAAFAAPAADDSGRDRDAKPREAGL